MSRTNLLPLVLFASTLGGLPSWAEPTSTGRRPAPVFPDTPAYIILHTDWRTPSGTRRALQAPFVFRASDTVTWHASSAETADGLIHAIPETVVEALADFVAAEDWKPLRYHLETEATAFFERVFEEPKSEYALSMDKVRNRRPSSEDLVVMTFDPRYRVISGRRGEPESRSDHLFLETWLTLRFFLVHREEDNAQFDRCELLFEDRALSEIRVPRHAWTRKDTLVLAQLVKDGTTKAFNSLRKVVGRSALLVSEPGTSVLDLKVRNDLLLRPHSGMKEGGQ